MTWYLGAASRSDFLTGQRQPCIKAQCSWNDALCLLFVAYGYFLLSVSVTCWMLAVPLVSEEECAHGPCFPLYFLLSLLFLLVHCKRNWQMELGAWGDRHHSIHRERPRFQITKSCWCTQSYSRSEKCKITTVIKLHLCMDTTSHGWCFTVSCLTVAAVTSR